MRKAHYQKAKKTVEPKPLSQRTKKDPMGASMSAPGKNKAVEDPEAHYFVTTTNYKLSDVNSAQGRLAATVASYQKDGVTSRFSSCTAKTSPSTDNQSNGNSHAAWDYLDASTLKAHICQPSHPNLQTPSGEPLSPNRPRACSDNPPNNGQSASPGKRIDQARESVTSEKNLQKTATSAFEPMSKFGPQTVVKQASKTQTRGVKGAHGRKAHQ